MLKINSLKKFLKEDFFYFVSLFLLNGVLCLKIGNFLSYILYFLFPFVFLTLFFFVIFKRRRFSISLLGRFISCVFLFFSAALISFLISGPADMSLFFYDRTFVFNVGANCMSLAFSLSIRLSCIRNASVQFSKLFRSFEQYLPDKKRIKSHYILSFVFLFFLSALLFYYNAFEKSLAIIILSCLSLLVSIFFLAKNPLTAREIRRIDFYIKELNRADSKDYILDGIRKRIEERWIRKYNLPFVENMIMAAVRIFYHLKVVGAGNIISYDEPAIFVMNHGMMIGPVCGVTYLPIINRPYTHHRMCDRAESANRMWYCTFKKVFKKMSDKTGLKIMDFIAKHITKWINSYEPILSYVDLHDPRKSMESMKNGLLSLLDGDSILIFPEDSSKSPTGTYQKGETGDLYSGFAHIGKLYGAKTGRSLYFYPVFVNSRLRTFNIGKPIIYDMSVNVGTEKKKVAQELKERMNEFS